MRQEFDSPYPHGIILSASLAQLVEQLPLKEMVGGSNPSRGIRVASQLLGLREDLKRFSILLGNGKSAPCKGESLTRHNLLYFLPEVGLEPTWACAHNILSVTCIPFHHSGIIEFLRPRSESNRRIGVLQTPALPLGYAAELYFYTANLQLHFPTSVQIKKCRR